MYVYIFFPLQSDRENWVASSPADAILLGLSLDIVHTHFQVYHESTSSDINYIYLLSNVRTRF